MADKKDKDKEIKKKDEPADVEVNVEDVGKELEELAKKLEEVDHKRNEAAHLAQRAQADYANLKRRFDKEREEISKYVTEMLLVQLLPSIDNLDRAVHYANSEEQSSSLFTGVKMTLQQLHDALGSIGVTQAEVAPGDEFDPNIHEAVELVDGDKDKVVEVLQTGYVMGEKVIRVARVKVGRGS